MSNGNRRPCEIRPLKFSFETNQDSHEVSWLEFIEIVIITVERTVVSIATTFR